MSSDYAIDDPTTTETASPPASPAPRRRLSRSASSHPARGILKNSNSTTRAATSNGNALVWDEGNLALNELQKDSTMKISEPKTPYVRYDAETDTVMDLDKIPGFELGQADAVAEGDDPTLPVHTTPPSPGTSSRRGSESNSRRGSESSEKMVKVERPSSAHGEDDDNDDDDDELADEETLAHRKQFAQKRGGHYRNEAEAMKRAQAMLAEEDDDSSDPDVARPPVPPMPTSGLAQSDGTTEEEEV
ncbi:BQ5605_C002g01792 [Microbotryum silenes-dioicae]|uniref:BQ5605_C002g01792 protein n=1 Tax=Microbotryum silenes-dioicae TaxID=796604 RepID=A0A2X0M3E7_9BASI|nr:BQ5605_C002g01792 [Microbotryum silenes-dioicae]